MFFFCATTSHDLVTLTFDLLTLTVFRVQCFVTFFDPELFIQLYNFYAATMTIKGSLYLSIPMLKRFSVAKVRQNRFPKWRFFGNLRVQI